MTFSTQIFHFPANTVPSHSIQYQIGGLYTFLFSIKPKMKDFEHIIALSVALFMPIKLYQKISSFFLCTLCFF